MKYDDAPNFTTSVLATLGLFAKRRGLLGIIPWAGLALIFIPCALVWYFHADLRPTSGKSDLISLLSAGTGVAGIVTAFSVAAAGQVYTVAGSYPFSDFLRSTDVLDQYLVWPQIIFTAQIVIVSFGVFCTGLALFSWSDWLSYAIASFLGALVYEMLLTWAIVDLMRKLTWHKADYDRLAGEADRQSP